MLWDQFSTTALAISIARLLARSPSSRVLVVAGAHTGRAPIAAFLRRAAARGLITDEHGLIERDIGGQTREWDETREDGDIKLRNRWLLEGQLKWADERLPPIP